MKVMNILGSPRAKGNTARILNWVEQQLLADGNEIDHAHIMNYSIQGCRECKTCKKNGGGLCAFDEDDANGLFERMIDSDMVLFASPVFACGFPAQLKALIDRSYSLVGDYSKGPDYESKLEDKALALLLTSEGPEKDNAEYVIKPFHKIIDMMKARDAGHLFIPYLTEPESIDKEMRMVATNFAREIITKANG
jgi:multimeric flavodoxin WrbA